MITGKEGLIGAVAETIEELNPSGYVKLMGEIWKAESLSGNIEHGKKVRIIKMHQLKLFVEPIHQP